MDDYLCSVCLGLLYILWLFLLLFDFRFLSTSQDIGWEEHLQNDLFCVKWDMKILTQSIMVD